MSTKRRTGGLLVKSIVFTAVTVLATAVLAGVIRSGSDGGGEHYTAIFTNATSLNTGDDIRVAGVKVGSVQRIELTDDRLAKVTFTVSDAVNLTHGTVAQLQFRNLIGQRYIDLEVGKPTAEELAPGYTFPVEQTRPALDLTRVFNGFRPLFKMLKPDDVNALTKQIIAVFQGEGATVETLLSSTANLTSTLAKKDKVIGALIDDLNAVLDTVNQRSDQVDTTIVTLQRLVSGLAEDRKTIGSTLVGLGNLTDSVADLLEQGRAPLEGSLNALGRLADNLADHGQVLDEFLKKLPTKLDRIGTLASYGSWINFYVCSIHGRIPKPEGYFGDLGVQPIAARCR